MTDIFDEFGATNPAWLVGMTNELAEGAFAIVNDVDRDFVDGVKLLIDMEEPVATEDTQRLRKIYAEFQKALHAGLAFKE